MTLRNMIKKLTVGLVAVFALALFAFGQPTVSATAAGGGGAAGGTGGTYNVDSGISTAGGDGNGGMSQKSVDDTVKIITQVLMYVVGTISVIIIIIAGISYATASGDEAKTKKARTAILGGLIGLAVAVLAWTLTSFVLNQL